MGVDDDELEALAERMARLVRAGMGSRSRWALRAALDAAETDGIAGVLSLKLQSKPKDQPDVMFCVGTVEVIQRWGS